MAEQSSIQQLVETFARFPGIGARQARRFVHYLLVSDREFIKNLIEQISVLKRSVVQCADCRRFFAGPAKTCPLCADAGRDEKMLLVTEKDVDLENIERSGAYAGRYFVLGALMPLAEEKNTFCRWPVLLQKIEAAGERGLREIIFALVASPEGDHTVSFLKQKIEPLRARLNLTISSFGRGLSTGTEVEYADPDTIRSAFRKRDPS